MSRADLSPEYDQKASDGDRLAHPIVVEARDQTFGVGSAARLRGVRVLTFELSRGRRGLAQMTRLNQGRVAVAILPARLDHHFSRVAGDPDHDTEPRAPVLDRIDGCFLRGQRQEGDDLAEIVAKHFAEIPGRHTDVTGDQCIAQRLGVIANRLFIHLGWPQD